MTQLTFGARIVEDEYASLGQYFIYGTAPVGSANAAPIAVNDVGVVAENGAVVLAVLANDKDPEGSALSIVSTTQPASGTTIVNGSSITYTQDPNFSGDDAFSYSISDGVSTASASVNITVNPANGPGCTEPTVCLTLGAEDTGQNGNNYGPSNFLQALFAEFDTDGSTNLQLSVIGYDIDFDDEVSVWLNGARIVYLSRGSNNTLNGGDTFSLSAAQLDNGTNTIEFRQRVAGWTWGVTRLLVNQ